MASMPAKYRFLFLALALALLAAGLFNFVKVETYSRQAHLQALAEARSEAIAPIPPDDFVRIPAGRFLMGSPVNEPGRSRSETQHPVEVSGFLLGRYLVTQTQWQAVMGRNPSYFNEGGDLPVEGVTWYDCIEFCNRQSRAEGRTACYSYQGRGADPDGWPRGWKHRAHDRIACDWRADGYRLPTEAEWEYACRAGTTSATPFGPGLSSRQANFNGEHPYRQGARGPNLKATAPVGSYPANAWGIFDPVGNIAQWCWDWYGDYPPGLQKDPRGAGPQSGHRVFRGGNWFSFGEDLRSANRFHDVPQFRLDMLPGGLRLARSDVPDPVPAVPSE
jgi:formylglycine-generating enzyme required for sulfatase activity